MPAPPYLPSDLRLSEKFRGILTKVPHPRTSNFSTIRNQKSKAINIFIGLDYQYIKYFLFLKIVASVFCLQH